AGVEWRAATHDHPGRRAGTRRVRTARRLTVATGRSVRPGAKGAAMMKTNARVLIVDDDADLAESLAEILIDHGCNVSIADHGQEAVERACAQDFDIIFMDVRMPV